MKRFILRVLGGAVSIYLFCLLVLFVFQRQLMYQPIAHTPQTPPGVERVTFETEDGLSLFGWHIPAPEGRPTLLFLHGNYGHLGMRVHKMNFWRDRGYGVFLFSWRGFSGNPGRPSEDGLYQDADAAIQTLMARGIAPRSIILYGESLGTGMAVEMATRHDVKAIVLEAPYSSVTGVAQERYPIFPVRALVWDHYDSLSKIDDVEEPVILMHGALDRIIPLHHAQMLYDAANEPKFLLIENGGDHNHLYQTHVIDRLVQTMLSLEK